MVDVVLKSRSWHDTKDLFDVSRYTHHGYIRRTDPVRHGRAGARFVLHERVEDAVGSSGVGDAPKRLLAFSESQPGKIIWLGRLEWPHFLDVIRVDVPFRWLYNVSMCLSLSYTPCMELDLQKDAAPMTTPVAHIASLWAGNIGLARTWLNSLEPTFQCCNAANLWRAYESLQRAYTRSASCINVKPNSICMRNTFYLLVSLRSQLRRAGNLQTLPGGLNSLDSRARYVFHQWSAQCGFGTCSGSQNDFLKSARMDWASPMTWIVSHDW